MSLAGKPGYTSTPCGWIPAGWSANRLSGLVDVIYGKSPVDIEKLQRGVPIYGTGGISGYTDSPLYDGPSIILGRKGTIDKVQRSDGPFWAIDTTFYTKPKVTFDWSWLYYCISSFDLRKLNEASGVPSLSRGSLEALDIATPPLPEQEKIATILTAVEDKLDVIARQIEAAKTLKQGLMQNLFSRGVGTQDANGHWVPHTEFKDSELGEIPSDWLVTTVGEVCEVKGGKRLPKGETLTEENTGHPYIRVTDMFMGGVDTAGILYVPPYVQASIARYTISKNDIFISVAGTLGLVGIVPEELDGANLTENADKLTDIKINRDYLFYCLCSDAIQDLIAREATSNAQPKLALKRIREFSFPLPSDGEQARIAAILAAVDEKLKLLSTKRESHLSLKRGLMQKLLTGEWRIKLDSPNRLLA